MKFQVGDKVMLKVSPWKRVVRFGKWGKLNPSTGTLSIGPVQNERIVRPTEGAIQKRLYKTQFLTLGSSSLVCQEEGWIILNVHRLSRTEQANGEESLSIPKD
nr:putative reverse transcriptase domain-containing protein [Tanacetum cinerariifolium]